MSQYLCLFRNSPSQTLNPTLNSYCNGVLVSKHQVLAHNASFVVRYPLQSSCEPDCCGSEKAYHQYYFF